MVSYYSNIKVAKLVYVFLCVCVCKCMWVLTEARRELWVLWIWSGWKLLVWCWEPNPSEVKNSKCL